MHKNSRSDKKKIVLFACTGVLIFCLAFMAVTSIWIGNNIRKSNAEDQRILNEVSKKIGVKPDWLEVRKFLYCDNLKEGMSHDEVYELFGLLGTYHIIGDRYDWYVQIYYEDRHIQSAVFPGGLVFENSAFLHLTRLETDFAPRADCE